MKTIFLFAALAIALTLTTSRARAWDYEGHRTVNQLALTTLPDNFPTFVKTSFNHERIAFLAGEPDRWRNQGDDVAFTHATAPEHYLDLEQLDDYGISVSSLPIFRYDFVAQLAAGRAAHPEKFPAPEPGRNKDHTRELIGFAPWAITECCGKLRSSFSYLKAFQDHGGTPEEIANAQADIIYTMGVMGHYVGDCSQPLHVTKHHHGWVGDNPKGYASDTKFHSWIDGGYFRKLGGIKLDAIKGKIRPAKIVGDPTKPDDLFKQVMAYLQETHKQLEPLYQLEKDGKLSGEGEKGLEGRAFLEGQLAKGGQMLGDLWFSAWQQAKEDTFLIRNLKERSAPKENKK